MTGVLFACVWPSPCDARRHPGRTSYTTASAAELGVLSTELPTSAHRPVENRRRPGQRHRRHVMSSAWATVFAVPVGLLAAIYLAEYRRNRLAGQRCASFSEQLGGVPSIVMGIFARACSPSSELLVQAGSAAAGHNSTAGRASSPWRS